MLQGVGTALDLGEPPSMGMSGVGGSARQNGVLLREGAEECSFVDIIKPYKKTSREQVSDESTVALQPTPRRASGLHEPSRQLPHNQGREVVGHKVDPRWRIRSLVLSPEGQVVSFVVSPSPNWHFTATPSALRQPKSAELLKRN